MTFGRPGSVPEPRAQAAALHPTANKAAPTTPVTGVSYNEHIRPILSENCYYCHGPDANHREADLRLDTVAGATADLGGYAAIVPGDREASELWLRINDRRLPMPPKDSHKKLTPEQIQLIGRWIDQGATYQEHWAYVTPARPAVPEVADADWCLNPIDRFIRARLDAAKVAPSAPASRRVLMRRVTLDLTGLPPTPQQVEAFMADTREDAYERYVDELLASPRFGEHLAVWWLDLVRYADTVGFHGDQPRSVWAYRDWVVQAFNEDMPFDRFTRLQLGGDLMQEQPTREMLIASAYNRLNPQTREGGAQPKEYQAIYAADRVSNFGSVWLGSSVGCAQCHDHKFDPFTQRDFYRIAAFFADINHANVGGGAGSDPWPPFTFLPQDEAQAAAVAANEAAYQKLVHDHPEAMYVEEHVTSYNPKPPLPGGKMPEWGGQLQHLINERANLANQFPYIVITRALPEPREVRVLPRGNWQDDSGPVVLPGTPEFLRGPDSSDERRLSRLDLADWLFDPSNPLTARVVANRLWGMYFGHAISQNAVDLGSQGAAPSHPHLLDWMALEFRDNGWNFKHLIRLIVTSQTYRQSSQTRVDLVELDPNNSRLFARQSALRLPAESVRDQALFVSGLLDDTLGGPSVFPYQPDGHWEALNFPRRGYPTSKGKDLYRRSLYTWTQRSFPHPFMVAFDAPTREVCTAQRLTSSSPVQSLALLNGPGFVEAARVLAQRVLTQDGGDDARIDQLYRLALSRAPRDSERQTLLGLLEKQRAYFQANPQNAQALTRVGQAPVPQGLDVVELAVWTSACRVVLNLHETVTRQ